MSNARALPYRKLALAEKDKAIADLLRLADECDQGSARLNGDRRGHPAKMSSRQEQETPSSGLSGTRSMTNVENLSRRKGTVMSDCPASAPVRQIWQLEERR